MVEKKKGKKVNTQFRPLPACRRLLFPLLHAGGKGCNKGNRRRLHAGNLELSVSFLLLTQEWYLSRARRFLVYFLTFLSDSFYKCFTFPRLSVNQTSNCPKTTPLKQFNITGLNHLMLISLSKNAIGNISIGATQSLA